MLRMASDTEELGTASLPPPCLEEDETAPGFSNASFGFSSAWICGGGGACGIPSGAFVNAPSFIAVSIFGGSAICGGAAVADRAPGNGLQEISSDIQELRGQVQRLIDLMEGANGNKPLAASSSEN